MKLFSYENLVKWCSDSAANAKQRNEKEAAQCYENMQLHLETLIDIKDQTVIDTVDIRHEIDKYFSDLITNQANNINTGIIVKALDECRNVINACLNKNGITAINKMNREERVEAIKQMNPTWCYEYIDNLLKNYTNDEIKDGYGIFDFGGGMMEIEKIDVMAAFKTDADAVAQAIKDNIKLIPIDELPDAFEFPDLKNHGWIDTEENREAINKFCNRRSQKRQ